MFIRLLKADASAARVAALTSGRSGAADVGLRFNDGRITVKESGVLGGAVGLSELKIIGSFDARPASPIE